MASGFPSIEERKAFRTKEASMMEDDPRFDPVIRRYQSVGGVWGWVAAVSSLLLIGLIIFASWDSSQSTTASRTAAPPSTEGSGSSSPKPITPAPSNSGTQ
jgi:hypothetical protein